MTPRRPNLLILVSDQQHAGMLSCAGNPHLATPNLDRLAAGGVRFERAYCTNPQCIPARFSLFTGRMPSEIGMMGNNSLVESVPPPIRAGGLGHLLREAGYTPLFAGQQHLPKMKAEDLGFDVLTHDSRQVGAEACAAFLRAPHDRPFALVCSLINPHDICYLAIRAFPRTDFDRLLLAKGTVEQATLDEALRRPDGIDEEAFFARHCPPLPANHAPQAREPEAVRAFMQRRPFHALARQHWSARDWRLHRWAYARLTERVDREFGLVLDALAAGPHAPDTFTCFTADHGDHDGAHKLEHKTLFYEEAIRIPWLMRGPGLAPGRVDRTTLVSALDLLPTLCAVAGATPPAGLHGASLLPLLRGGAAPARRSVYIQNELGHCVVLPRHKLARYDFGADAEQLYDREGDPGEMDPVADAPAHAAALVEARAELDAWRVGHGFAPVTPPAGA